MAADLPDEQATQMSNEIADVKQQWKTLIDGLNTLKERYGKEIYKQTIDSIQFYSILILDMHLDMHHRNERKKTIV